MRGTYGFFLIMALCAGLAGCASPSASDSPVPPLPQAMPVNPPPGSDMLTANIFAGDALSSMLLLRVGSGSGIVAASFVELDDPEQTSAFGRLVAQQIGSRIGQRGFRVLEPRMGHELRMDARQGEFLLTRDSARLMRLEYDAHAALVGVYTVAGENLFVSARVVRLSDNALLGAYEYYIPVDGDTHRLLAGNSGGAAAWNSYAGREPAFAAGRQAQDGTPKADGTSRSAPASAGSGPAPSLGVRIDPSAPPMPFPGGRR